MRIKYVTFFLRNLQADLLGKLNYNQLVTCAWIPSQGSKVPHASYKEAPTDARARVDRGSLDEARD